MRCFCKSAESLDEKHVFITGGSEGLGFELAKQSVLRGANVTIVARTMSKLEAARTELCKDDPNLEVLTLSADVTDRSSLTDAVSKSVEHFGPIDVCIAAAGLSIPKYFEDCTEEDFAKMMNVNYMGVVHLAHVVLPSMTKRNSGHFCAVSSMASAIPFAGYAAYAPSKAACKTLVDVLRNEFADTNVKFHISCPPDMDTAGFATENSTKPYETSHMWPSCFNEVHQVKDVAKGMIDDLLKGHYFLRSPDCFGDLLVSRAWGHHPRKCAVFEAIASPIFVGVQSMMLWWSDSVVRRRAHHRATVPSESDDTTTAAESVTDFVPH